MSTFADLQSGRVFWLGPDAGIQWRIRPIYLRLISVDTRTSWEGTAHLDGYELGVRDQQIVAVETRQAYVIVGGLVHVRTLRELWQRMGYAVPAEPVSRPVNGGPAAIPRQRTSTPARSTTR